MQGAALLLLALLLMHASAQVELLWWCPLKGRRLALKGSFHHSPCSSPPLPR